jgi:Domain of unknown function (DUF4157)
MFTFATRKPGKAASRPTAPKSAPTSDAGAAPGRAPSPRPATSNDSRGAFVQPKLRVGPADDALEREADRVATQVMRAPCGACAAGGTCPKCRAGAVAAPDLRRKAVDVAAAAAESTPEVDGVIRSSGNALDGDTLRFMEARFGHDFGRVRLHTGAEADRAARSIGARAFTAGPDVVFANDQYAPGEPSGRWLLAHELSHVVQQGAAARLPAPVPNEGGPAASATGGAAGRTGGVAVSHAAASPVAASPGAASPVAASGVVQRAVFQVGALAVDVDFGGLGAILAADFVREVESRFIAYTGAPDASAIHASLSALAPAHQRWVLYALDLLQDNTRTPRDGRLDRVEAVRRLIAFAPSAAGSFQAGGFAAEEEALRASGWFEVALAGNLPTPGATDLADIDAELNPPTSSPGAALDRGEFRRRMRAGVRTLLAAIDPANWPSTGTDSLPTLQSMGNDIMDEARDFFSPLPASARASVFGLSPPFHISANIFSVTTMTPTQSTRLSYLRNRATMVGRNTTATASMPDTNIFRDVNFDGNRATDQGVFASLIRSLERNSTVAAQVNRLIRHTGRQSGSGAAATIGLSTEFNSAAATECEARWRLVDTLCHEVLHALTNPELRARAATVGFSQVLIEGFTEVLGVQLFNQRVKPKSISTSAFKARLEAGLASAPCPTPADATVGYAEAGAAAERILGRIGDNRFRAAYFLGQTHLIGL